MNSSRRLYFIKMLLKIPKNCKKLDWYWCLLQGLSQFNGKATRPACHLGIFTMASIRLDII